MTRFRPLTATLLAVTALIAGRSAFGIDPGRSPSGNPVVPQPQDLYLNQYLPGISGQQVGTTLPLGLQPQIRGRANDPATSIPISLTAPISTLTTPGYQPGATLTPNYLPPGAGNTGPVTGSRWKLGVYSKDTDTGVRIIQVVNGSAAQRGGLEANDTIVCVAGYQVGYVNGVPYDCAHEFERNCDADGWVRLLVQNGRDGRLVALPLQLDTRFDRLDGSVTYRELYNLPRDAIATVELREILRPGAPAVTLSRKVINGITTTPIPFVVDYDASQIDPRRTYVLTANITSQNRTLFSSRQTCPVINNGGSTRNIALLVESPGSVQTQPGGSPYVSRDQQIDQVVQWFRDYLHRDPRAQELAAWQSHLDRGGSLQDAQVQILSMPEYYARSDANDVKYIQDLHQSILGKQPTPEELAYWLDRMKVNNRLRPEVAREFLVAVGVSR